MTGCQDSSRGWTVTVDRSASGAVTSSTSAMASSRTAALSTKDGRTISAIRPTISSLFVLYKVAGWIAVRGMDRQGVLDALGLVEAPDGPKPKASICDLPNGWSVLFTTDFGFPTPERMALLSAEGAAIAVSAEEHVMLIAIRGYERGQAVFANEHNGGNHGARHIATAGEVPYEWSDILYRANRE